MKKLLMILWLAAGTTGALSQGTVTFLNTSSTLISWAPGPQPVSPIPPSSVSTFYFAVLTAPVGTTDRSLFTFSGLYATNLPTAGMIFGGSGRTVNGWIPGTSMSFEVAGWSADGGPTWNPAWATFPTGMSLFGLSIIGSGVAGGIDPVTGSTIPALHIFGASPAMDQGFILTGPEPTTMTLAAFGAAVLLVFRRRE